MQEKSSDSSVLRWDSSGTPEGRATRLAILNEMGLRRNVDYPEFLVRTRRLSI